MRSKFIIAGTLMALALTGCGSGISSGTEESFVAGNGALTFIAPAHRSQAPKISGATIDGKNFTLAAGEIAVINIWASWCAPCRAEAPTLAALSKKYSKVAFLGILTRDNNVAANAFVKRFAIPYPTLADDEILLHFKGAMIASAIPTTLIIDKNGKVAARISGEITVASLSTLIERVTSE